MKQSITANNSKAPRNYSVDTLKFFCALLVVFIHAGGPLSVDIINRVAVPCFFVISGFFLYRKESSEMQNRLISALKNISIITLWSTVFYAAISFVPSLNDTPTGEAITLISVTKKIIAFIFFNNPIWGFHLWYLFAYIYTLIAVLLVYKLKLQKLAYYSIPLLLLVSVFGGLYSFVLLGNIRIPLLCTRNFLFTGIPYFLIGMLIKAYNEQIFRSKNIIYIGFIVSVLLSVCEFIINPRALGSGLGDLYLTTAPMAIAIFLLSISLKQTKDNIFSKIGREDSLYIYIFHPFTMMVLSKIDRMFLTENSIYYDYYKLVFSILVFLITIVVIYLFRISILPLYRNVIAKFSRTV